MRLGQRRFWVALAAIALAGFGLRLLYTKVGIYSRGFADDLWYHIMANAIANGHGLTVPVGVLNGKSLFFDYSEPTVPTAFHPPLFPALLSIGSKLGLSSYDQHRAIGCAFGAATGAVIGLIGRRIGGDLLGLVAAALGAVYLPLVANDSVLMSESLFGLTIAVTILAAFWFLDAPTWRRAAGFGAAIGLAALTRSEALLLVILMVPFVVRRGGVRPLRLGLVAAAATALVIAPWCVRNSLQFDRPTAVTTGDGAVLAGANDETSYYTGRVGTWDFGGLELPPPPPGERYNEALGSARLRHKGLRYARHHAGRAPVVVAVRVLRTWSIYPFNPVTKVRENASSEGRRKPVEWATELVGWAVMLLAIAGAVALRRRGAALAPLLAQLVLVTIVSAAFYGNVRFREAADVALVVLAAVALSRLRRPAGGGARAAPAR